MPAGNSSKNKSQHFKIRSKAGKKTLKCYAVLSKTNEMKSCESSEISDTLEKLGDHLVADSGKLPEGASEKTALHVLTLLVPIMDAIISTRNDNVYKDHETRINKL